MVSMGSKCRSNQNPGLTKAGLISLARTVTKSR